MNALSMFEHPDVRILGWTLLHFVWQGTLVALALAVTNACLLAWSARARYVAASAALFTMLALPLATFVVLGAAPLPAPLPVESPGIAVSLPAASVPSVGMPALWTRLTT